MNNRDKSRSEWNSSQSTLEAINSGSLQRIADATEKMASNYTQLQNDLDLYKRWYNDESEQNKKLTKQISSLKGIITKLKKKKI